MIHPVNSRLQRIAFPDNNTHAGSIQSAAGGVTKQKISQNQQQTKRTKAHAGKKRQIRLRRAALFVPAPVNL